MLALPRDKNTLSLEVQEMRDKLRQHHGVDSTEVKHASGGVVDLEFISQYLVLAYGAQQPALYQYSDNIRILEAAAAVGLMPMLRSAGFTAGLSGFTRHQSPPDAGTGSRDGITRCVCCDVTGAG